MDWLHTHAHRIQGCKMSVVLDAGCRLRCDNMNPQEIIATKLVTENHFFKSLKSKKKRNKGHSRLSNSSQRQ